MHFSEKIQQKIQNISIKKSQTQNLPSIQDSKTRKLRIFSKNFESKKEHLSLIRQETLTRREANAEYFKKQKLNENIVSKHSYECYEERLGCTTAESQLLTKLFNWSLKNYTCGGNFQTKVSVKYLAKVLKRSESTIRNYLNRLVDNDDIEVKRVNGDECMHISGYRQNLQIVVKRIPKDHEEIFEEVFGTKFNANVVEKSTDVVEKNANIVEKNATSAFFKSEMPCVSAPSEAPIYNKKYINNNYIINSNYSKNGEEDGMEFDRDEVSTDISDECIEAKEFRFELASRQGIPWTTKFMQNNVKIESHEINYKKALVLKFKNEDLIEAFKANYYKTHDLILKYNVKFGNQWQFYESYKPHWKTKNEEDRQRRDYKLESKRLDDKTIVDSDTGSIISSIEDGNECEKAKEFRKFALMKLGKDSYVAWVKNITIEEVNNILYLYFENRFVYDWFQQKLTTKFEDDFNIECVEPS